MLQKKHDYANNIIAALAIRFVPLIILAFWVLCSVGGHPRTKALTYAPLSVVLSPVCVLYANRPQ